MESFSILYDYLLLNHIIPLIYLMHGMQYEYIFGQLLGPKAQLREVILFFESW